MQRPVRFSVWAMTHSALVYPNFSSLRALPS